MDDLIFLLLAGADQRLPLDPRCLSLRISVHACPKSRTCWSWIPESFVNFPFYGPLFLPIFVQGSRNTAARPGWISRFFSPLARRTGGPGRRGFFPGCCFNGYEVFFLPPGEEARPFPGTLPTLQTSAFRDFCLIWRRLVSSVVPCSLQSFYLLVPLLGMSRAVPFFGNCVDRGLRGGCWATPFCQSGRNGTGKYFVEVPLFRPVRGQEEERVWPPPPPGRASGFPHARGRPLSLLGSLGKTSAKPFGHPPARETGNSLSLFFPFARPVFHTQWSPEPVK